MREVAIIDGVRTPFLRSNGAFSDLAPHDLGRFAVQGLLKKTGIDRSEIDHLVMGTVISDPKAPNLAREVLLGNSIPEKASAFTLSMACISSNIAVAVAADQIKLGRYKVAISGGAETLSDFPIRHSKKVRQALIRLQKAKGMKDYLKEMKKLSFKDLVPDVPTVTEFSTGLSMGQSCERLAKRIGVTRAEADAFSLASHLNAARAWKSGYYEGEVQAVSLAPHFRFIETDDGPRGDSTKEGMEKLKPSFDRKNGQITAGNSSFLTDGGSALLMMEKEKAQALGFKPKAYVKDYLTRGTEPLDDLLLGPAFVITELLKRHGLELKDIGVWEIHEAFASQMVANMKVMNSKSLSREILGMDPAGEIPMDKLNTHGGSLALGHPFGATGARLVMTAAKRLILENARYAIVSGCAAGGHGLAMLLEHPGE
ncbi:MAG: acetyl-CoA C-acyltransferase [Deltaproteobacteria bacterium]|nr:acetyl-CoA C-acyltransferase [Deltaproteobacteria bacterium]